jgi:hypothetical protein
MDGSLNPAHDAVYGPSGFDLWSEEGLIEEPPFWTCGCGNTNRLRHGHFLDYFDGVEVTCEKCGLSSDLWKVLQEVVRRGNVIGFYSMIGGRLSACRALWPQDSDNLEVSLDAMRIPADALLLFYSFVPTTSTPGIEFDPEDHELMYRATRVLVDLGGGGPLPRPGLPRSLHFVKANIDERKQVDDVRVMVVWAPDEIARGPWGLLANAAQSYRSGQSRAAIVSANAAVESALRDLLETLFTREATANAAEDLLTNGATYGHQLNALIPAVASWRGWPSFSGDLRGKLNRLRKLRNQNAHGSADSVDWNEIAELILAALFALHYLSIAQEREGCFVAPWPLP